MTPDVVEVRDLREQDWLWTSKALLFNPHIDGNTYKVYCGLASYADNQSQLAFPSITTLAKRLHVSRVTAIKSLQRLEDNGFISIKKSEGEHNTYYLLKIDADPNKKPKTVKVKAPDKVPSEDEDWVKKILEWAEKRKGSRFVTYGKQIGSLGLMKKAGYSPREICECYIMLERSEFWRTRGFDFKNVGDEIPKKINAIRKTNVTAFEHLTKREA